MSETGLMPGIRAILSALAVMVCAIGLAACGGDDDGTIPPETGDALIGQLDQVEDAVQAGECDVARAGAVAFASGVNELPSDVDSEVRDALVGASARLVELSEDPEQCTPLDTGDSGTGETLPPPESTTTTDTTETTTTEDPPDDDETGGGPPSDPPGGGNGNPGGGAGNGDDQSGGIGSDG